MSLINNAASKNDAAVNEVKSTRDQEDVEHESIDHKADNSVPTKTGKKSSNLIQRSDLKGKHIMSQLNNSTSKQSKLAKLLEGKRTSQSVKKEGNIQYTICVYNVLL